jgi:hypothetical protein
MFKKAVIVLLLLTTPFAQARAVMICSMTNDQVVERCHCPDQREHRMPMRHDAPDATCCDVEMRVSDETFAGIGTEQPTLKRAAHDVPDAVVLAPATPFLPTLAVAQRPPAYAFVTNHVPDRLYLRTARLRL